MGNQSDMDNAVDKAKKEFFEKVDSALDQFQASLLEFHEGYCESRNPSNCHKEFKEAVTTLTCQLLLERYMPPPTSQDIKTFGFLISPPRFN